MDQETEPQVVQGEPLQMPAQRPARSQPLADRGDDLRADLVVADEGDVPRSLGARVRLAEIVEERAEAQRALASQLVRERFRQERLDLSGQVAGESLEIGLDAEPLLQHREGVAEDVEVMIRVL